MPSLVTPSQLEQPHHHTMPRPTKRRQAETTSCQAITSFTRVSKGSNRFDVPAKKNVTVSPATTPLELPNPTRKRKASLIDDDAKSQLKRRTVSFSPSSDEDEDSAPAEPTSNRSKRACRRDSQQAFQQSIPAKAAATKASVPTKGKRTAKAPPSRVESAHKPSEATVIASSRQSSARKLAQTKIEASFKKAAAKAQEKNSGQALPQHLIDLIGLHNAFLKTITIHLAHEGDVAPVDFSTLAPNMSRSWGKRQITVEDIRRCIAIQSAFTADEKNAATASPFIITDYGRGKVCIEIDPSYREQAGGAALVDSRRLSRQFEQNLRRMCAAKAVDEMADVDIPLDGLSLDDLPKAAITDRKLGLEHHHVLSKGQRALAELKNGIAARQQEKDMAKVKQQQAANQGAQLNQDGTKMSLLDRLRLKQLARENEAAPPSGPELQRRAALNRVADVTATISMLSLSNPLSLPRQAFTMPAIMERLKDSLRVPMSVEEGTICVRLIASEVAPEWLRVVSIGGRENVVVQRNCQPVDRVLQERVQKLLG